MIIFYRPKGTTVTEQGLWIRLSALGDTTVPWAVSSRHHAPEAPSWTPRGGQQSRSVTCVTRGSPATLWARWPLPPCAIQGTTAWRAATPACRQVPSVLRATIARREPQTTHRRPARTERTATTPAWQTAQTASLVTLGKLVSAWLSLSPMPSVQLGISAEAGLTQTSRRMAAPPVTCARLDHTALQGQANQSSVLQGHSPTRHSCPSVTTVPQDFTAWMGRMHCGVRKVVTAPATTLRINLCAPPEPTILTLVRAVHCPFFAVTLFSVFLLSSLVISCCFFSNSNNNNINDNNNCNNYNGDSTAQHLQWAYHTSQQLYTYTPPQKKVILLKENGGRGRDKVQHQHRWLSFLSLSLFLTFLW